MSETTINPSDYSCQILQEKTTLEEANDKSLPNDGRLIWYTVDGVEKIDLTRCRKDISNCLTFIMISMVRVPSRRLTLDLVLSIPNCGDMKRRRTRRKND